MVQSQRFGSWTALLVARPLIHYWIWGEPIRSILTEIIPSGSSELTRDVLRQGCGPIMSAIIDWRFFVPVVFWSWIARYLPKVPSFDISMCLRKRYFYDRVVESIEAGAKQVIYLGGGYDVLIINLSSRYPNVLFVEVDHPNTSIFKRAAVEKLGYQRPNTHYLPIDLSRFKLEDQLPEQCPEWNMQAKSVVIAEGLFMYLTPEAVRQCLRSMKAISAPGSTLVFSYLTKTGLGSIVSRSVFGKSVFDLVGEPLYWAPDSADDVAKLIDSEEFQADVSPAQSDNYQRYLAKYGKLPCYKAYLNKNGIAISK